MSTEPTTHSSELIDEVSAWLVGGGILTVALFPLAVPLIALTVVSVIPLLLVPLAAGLVVAAVAGPILLIRSLGRLAIRVLGARGSVQPGHPGFRQRKPGAQPRAM